MIDLIYFLRILSLLASFSGAHGVADYIQLTYFPKNAPVETIVPTMPPPCRPITASQDIKKVPVKATLYQIHPESQYFGVVCQCFHEVTVTSTGGICWSNIRRVKSGGKYKCSKIDSTIIQVLYRTLKGNFTDSILPYQTKILDLSPEDEEYPCFGQNTNNRWLFHCTKMPFSQNIHRELVDPHPENNCSKVPCYIDPYTVFYSRDFKGGYHDCLLMKIIDMTGLIIYESISKGKIVIFTSDAHGRDLTFSGGEVPTVECRTQTQDNIILSLEGVYVSFKSDSQPGDPLLSLYGHHSFKIKLQTEVRTIRPSTKLDAIPISQQNRWIYTRQTLDEVGIMNLTNKMKNSTIYDLLTIKHMQCELKRQQDMTTYYLAEQFPVAYLANTLPENSFLLVNRKPIKIKRGSRLLYQISSLPVEPYCYNNSLKLSISGKDCTIQNITGIFHCTLQNGSIASPCRKTLNTFILPTSDGLWYDVMTHRRKDQNNDYSLFLNLFNSSFTPIEINYTLESSYQLELEKASLLLVDQPSNADLDNSWGLELDNLLGDLFNWKSIIKFGIIIVVGFCVFNLVLHLMF